MRVENHRRKPHLAFRMLCAVLMHRAEYFEAFAGMIELYEALRERRGSQPEQRALLRRIEARVATWIRMPIRLRPADLARWRRVVASADRGGGDLAKAAEAARRLRVA